MGRHPSYHRWNSKDGRFTFITNEHGMTDILPGPKSDLLKRLDANYFDRAKLSEDNIKQNNHFVI